MRERQRAEIVRTLLAERGFLSIADIMAATGVSAASARRDAARLAEAGLAERLHGGVQAVDGSVLEASPRALATRSFDSSRTSMSGRNGPSPARRSNCAPKATS